MNEIKIIGKRPLRGKVHISGSKNSVVSLIPAALLSDKVVINRIPNISDVVDLEDILRYLHVDFIFDEGALKIDNKNLTNREIAPEYSTRLRASYYFMGALLGKYKKVSISLPGGCSIGARAIDFHLEGFKKLGATVSEKDSVYTIEADTLKGAMIKLPFPSVGATVNLLLASVLAEGTTVIENAACEPEIGNLIEFLVSMGAKIKGENTNRLVIDGVKELHGGEIEVIPDRIEAGTYILAGIISGDNLEVCDIRPDHLTALFDKLNAMGADFEIRENSVIVNKSAHLKPVDVVTGVYPGFATDLQQPMTSLLLLADGVSTIKETIYENRFQNVQYLNSMGANIEIDGDTIKINGPTYLSGKLVKTSDLRAGAALILAALGAEGETTITDIKHLLRGYGDLIGKFSSIGAEIWLAEEYEG